MKHIIFVLILFPLWGLQAQQEAQFTQYLPNVYLHNPAMVGNTGEHNFRFFVRQNWAVFDDAPFTIGTSYQGLIGDQHGVGGLIYMDRSGPFRVLGIKGAYAFHIPVSEKGKLALGLAAKYYQSSIRTQDLTIIEQNDLSIDLAQARGMAITGDAEFGIYYYSPNFYIGAASSNLIQTKLAYAGVNDARLYRHYFANAGVKFKLNEDVGLEPFAAFRMVNTLHPQADIGLEVNIYEEQIEAGIAYRTNNNASIYFSGAFDDNFLVTFSIDFVLGGVVQYGLFNYEAIIGYDLPRRMD